METSGRELFRNSAREVARVAMMTALLLVVQLALSGVQGVEVVTVCLLSFCVVFGVRRGIAVATSFSLLRCLLFGFMPNVVVLYLVYYNLFALVFGLLGKAVRPLLMWKQILILAAVATVMTACFTLIDDLLTPWMLGYSAKTTRVYFLASLPAMGIQCACAAISVSLLYFPLKKVFLAVR